MPYFEIVMVGYKHFVVEADSEEEALNHHAVHEEESCFGEVEWEHDETRVTCEVSEHVIEHERNVFAADVWD